MSKEINEYKTDVLLAFYNSFASDDVATPLIIQTSNGIINGHLINKEDFVNVYDDDGNFIGDTEDKNFYYSAVNTKLNLYREKSSFSEENKDFLKGIWLKKVKLFLPNQSNPIEVPFYHLFLDQIVGVTVGDLKTSSPKID